MKPFKATALSVVVVMAALTLSGCEQKSDVLKGAGSSGATGKIYARNTNGKLYWIMVRKNDRKGLKVFVRRSAYVRCKKGAQYPACAKRRTTR
jgi:hypothetical protein